MNDEATATTNSASKDATFRPFLFAGLALAACVVGDACTRQDDSVRTEPVVEAAVEAAAQPPTEKLVEEIAHAVTPTTGAPTTVAPTTLAPAVPVTAVPTTAAPTTAAPTTVAPVETPAPTVAPDTTAAPAPTPEPEPEPTATWDGLCGPNDPMPADAIAVTTALIDVTGQGTPGTVTTYRSGDEWYLRFDGAVVSDEMLLDAPANTDVRVATGVDISGFGAHDILVAIGEDGPFTELGLFSNHDGCLFQYEQAPGEALRFKVGVDDHRQTMFGVTCHTDEFGSFITSQSAVSNGDGTWNTYGTFYTYGAPFQLESGDGGHSFGLPDDHSTIGSFANVWCGDAELGEF